mmetsp:Transcript_115169/g.229392  ORF Transcript_115169/g.229392 Transcript_115169/m.229392 type:complete len:466 (-) Transcript_115169:69-1466(-)|eukprot:CAMPEP_0172691376 /NCGR_PEP_ID=MMETSP1074-20121228/24506_1 /TAXON_ID=2916 /ORGANISM="Ceratium fusus, Strain PA161109" /LENGTH=465 /DNA_ID=CAMNT_0013511431 /DNA_START=54 /DNA_END=1451 /DNA_ORIENTATION=-
MASVTYLERNGGVVFAAVGGAVFGAIATRIYMKSLREQPEQSSEVGKALPHNRDCVYLDWNATTPIFPEATAALLPFASQHFGNASSSHAYGGVCGKAIAEARSATGKLIGAAAPSKEIVFCGCGSEADNLAIRGTVLAAKKSNIQDIEVVTSNIEHPAVTACLRALKDEGLISDFIPVPVDREGLLDPKLVAAAVKPGRTALVTIMHSNNEVGSVQPIQEIVVACRHAAQGYPLLVHTDAAQSIGKVPFDVAALDVDLATVVGHKFGAPKGVAALYVRTGVCLEPICHGGGQEHGLRAGTECVPLIVALGAAADVVRTEAVALHRHLKVMRERLLANLQDGLGKGNVRVNGPAPAEDSIATDTTQPRALPNTLSVGLRGIKAGKLLQELRELVAASAGAACHTADQANAQISFVLQAMQVPHEFALGTLRLSVGRHTTATEVDRASELIINAARCQMRAESLAK